MDFLRGGFKFFKKMSRRGDGYQNIIDENSKEKIPLKKASNKKS